MSLTLVTLFCLRLVGNRIHNHQMFLKMGNWQPLHLLNLFFFDFIFFRFQLIPLVLG